MFFSKVLSKKKSILGVDIGTANIKIAQVSHGDKAILETYGIVNTAYQLSGKNDELAIERMAEILKTLLRKANISTKYCVISFPNSAVFTSVIQMPKMNEREMNSAVEFEAKKYVPLALTEIDLSWTPVGGGGGGAEGLKVLLTAVPKQVTRNYMKVFELAGLEPRVGEIEALALIRSLIGNVPTNCVIIDIGARTTGLNIIQNGFLRLSRNLNIGGDTVTDKISQALNISIFRAEQFKKDFGVSGSTFIPETVQPVLNIIKNEVKQLLTIYQSQNVQVEKIFLVGGGANLPGIVNFFEDLNIKVELGNPLAAVSFAKDLEPVLKRFALSLPIAIGLALRNEN
jgi:type IV pilus assembly protein PilM